MALNIKNPEVEQLAADIAALAKETKTEAIRRALLERKDRLMAGGGRLAKHDRIVALLQNRIWPTVPRHALGRKISKKTREEILGYGPRGF